MTKTREREFAFTDRDFQFLAGLVNEHTGIMMPKHKSDMVYARLTKRLRSLNLQSFKEYCELLEQSDGDEELIHFVNSITTNLTGFFREGHHFDDLKQRLQAIKAHPPASRRIRIWSCASSTGQEPYSIAMTVADVFENAIGWDIKILATDIDTNVLATARAGEYSTDMLSKIPEAYHKKYIEISKDGQSFTFKEAITKMITFNPLNLLSPWPMKGKFDIVFCRNVVIYFDKATQRTLFDRIADAMTPDGWLYIGHSENLFAVCDRFKLHGKTIYQRSR